MPAPPEHADRNYNVLLRGPIGSFTFGFAIHETYRAGVQHAGLLADFPEPQDNASDDFGIQEGGGFTVEIADEMGSADWFVLQENGSRILLEDGSGALIMEY